MTNNDWPEGDLPPLSPPIPRGNGTACSIDAGQLLTQIEEMQNSGDYTWASDSLEGIYTTVEAAGYATEGQQRAVDNIEEGGRRHTHERRGGW